MVTPAAWINHDLASVHNNKLGDSINISLAVLSHPPRGINDVDKTGI